MLAFLSASLFGFAWASGPFPVIGIMSHPTKSDDVACGGHCEYVAASYVKFVELAGARAVPISYYSTEEEIDNLMAQINGVLFPGGEPPLPNAAKRVMDNAFDVSASGGFFPIWGACLGFEWIVQAVGGKQVLSNGLDSENISLALNFTKAAEDSRLYPADLRQLMARNAVAMNNHVQGLTPATFEGNAALKEAFHVLATNLDRNGREFVSSIEGTIAPIYGVQYHPEKNIYEWGTYPSGKPYEAIHHDEVAVQATQEHANFFVEETRKNGNIYDLSQKRLFFEDYQTSTDMSPDFVEVYYLFPRKESMQVV